MVDGRSFRKMDKILGPPPAPIAGEPKQKKGLFSIFKKDKNSPYSIIEKPIASTIFPKKDMNKLTQLKKIKAEKEKLETGAVKKAVSETSQELGELEKRKEILAKEKQKMEQRLNEMIIHKNDLLDSIKKRELQLKQLEKNSAFRSLSEREASLQKTEEKIQRLMQEFRAKEFELHKKENEIRQEEEHLEKEQKALKESIDSEHQRFEMSLAEKEALMRNKYAVLEKNLEKRERQIANAEKNYNKEKGKLYAEFEKEKEHLTAQLRTEKERVYKDLIHEKGSLKDEIIQLETKKREMECSILEKQETMCDLNETEKMLEEKETQIIKKIKELESTENLLQEKENEITRSIKEIEKDKKTLDEKENELLEVVKKLDIKETELKRNSREEESRKERLCQLEKELARKARELDEKLEAIKANQLLKESTASLEKTAVKLVGEIETLSKKKENIIRIEELNREVKSLTASKQKVIRQLENERTALETEINKLVAKVSDMEQMAQTEDKLKQRQEFVSRKEEALEKEHDRIQNELIEMEKSSTQALAAMSLSQKQRNAEQEIFQADSREKIEIYAMIEQAREAIVTTNYDLAKQIYRAIQEAYRQLTLEDEEKKRIYFDVLELKTDIELNSMA